MPRVIGNVKGLQDPYRNPETQKGFAEQWGQNPAMVTSFADGSKISFEQAIVANATGFTVQARGMSRGDAFDGSPMELPIPVRRRRGARARRHRRLHRRPAGREDVLPGRAPRSEAAALPRRSTRWATARCIPFWIPYHLPHFEAPNSIARVALFGDGLAPPLGGPFVEVCAVAKRDLEGGRDPRRVRDVHDLRRGRERRRDGAGRYLPEGLVEGCRLRAIVAKDEVLTYDDVELPRAGSRTGSGRAVSRTSAARHGSRSGCSSPRERGALDTRGVLGEMRRGSVGARRRGLGG